MKSMKRTLSVALLALTLSSTGCDLWANHPISTGAVLGGIVLASGVALAADHHPLVGGTLIGASTGVFAISIPIGIIIDGYDSQHKYGR